jgi:cytosine/adenosine deaminase-related metal-dependent hydrolase
VACIFALTSKTDPADGPRALRYLTESLRQGFGTDLLARDADLEPLRPLPQFQQLARAAALWHAVLRR